MNQPAHDKRMTDPQGQPEVLSPRAAIKKWTREAWKASGKNQHCLSELFGMPSTWLSMRISPANNALLSMDMLKRLAIIARHELPPEVIEARKALDERRAVTQPLSAQIWGNHPIPTEGETVADELRRLIEIAHHHVRAGTKDRLNGFMRQRFGLGGSSGATLAEVGEAFGVTRERIRQVEHKMLSRLAKLADTFTTPKLDEVYRRAARCRGMPLASVEGELKPLLGNAPLKEALRFHQALRPVSPEVRIESALIYGQFNLPVLCVEQEDTRLVQVTSSCARKLVTFSGACMVNDLRTFVEDQHGVVVGQNDIVRIVDVFPDAAWLGGDKRWFWYGGDETSGLLNRAALIVSLAQCPVDIETLYAGLARETRRPRDSEAVNFCDPIPPMRIVQAMLDDHPMFRRRKASSFELCEPFDAQAHLSGYYNLMVETLEVHGGVAARSDFMDVPKDDGEAWSKDSLGVGLYLAGFIERIGDSLYAIRGREISDASMQAARNRVLLHYSEHSIGWGPRPILSPDGIVVVNLEITPTVKRNRNVAFKRSDIPADIAGEYEMPAHGGHTCRLVDDVHSVRLVSLGKHLTDVLIDGQGYLRFEFDTNRRVLQWSLKGAEDSRPVREHVG